MSHSQEKKIAIVLSLKNNKINMFKIIIFTIIWCAILKSEAANILGVFPTPSISHQAVYRPIMLELAKRGHKVTIITPSATYYTMELEPSQPNVTIIDVHEFSDEWEQYIYICITKKCDIQTQITLIFNILIGIFEEQMKCKNIQDLINDKNKKFDLVFYEYCIRSAIGFSYLYKAPAIEISSLAGYIDTYDGVGAISHRLFYPFFSRQRIYNLTLWEKISELYMQFFVEYSYKTRLEESENKILKNVFGPEIPDLSKLRKNIQMVFLNVHPIWDFNRPVPPNVIYLGGLPQNPEKELPKDLKSYLDASKNGVIYISFGSNINFSRFSQEILKIFINVFANLPYEVLMKWDEDVLPGQPRNVRISKWFPQSDLLKHPKIKLFITQGGLQSTDEAVKAGVPVIVIPLIADQWFNSEQVVIHGIGIKLSMETITEATLKEAIETVTENKRYRENIVKLRSIMNDQPQSALERAVWWTEYALRHGGASHLRAAAAHVPWPQYYMLDVAVLLLAMLLATLMTITLVMRLIIKKYKAISVKVKKD